MERYMDATIGGGGTGATFGIPSEQRMHEIKSCVKSENSNLSDCSQE